MDPAAVCSLQAQGVPDLLAQLRTDVAGNSGTGILYHNLNHTATRSACYNALKEWVESSLDMYKAELTALMYPLFVRLYLELVDGGHMDEARAFMAKFRGYHSFYNEEVIELSSVLTPDQIRTSDIASQYWTSTFEVELSALAFELLISFLQAEQLVHLITLLNSKAFSVRVNRRTPALGTGPETLSKAVRSTEVRAINELPTTLAPLAELHEEHERLRRELQGAPAAEEGTMGRGPASAAAKRAKAATSTATTSRIPLPAWTREVEKEVVVDEINRTPVGPEALPSCCMLTFLNADDTINTIDFSSSAESVACGLSDSSITVCRLDRLRKAQLVEDGDAEQGEGREVPGLGRVLIGHSGPVFSLCFSRDEEFLLSSSQDGTARLWSVSDKGLYGNCLVCYRSHAFPVWDVEFSPLGYYFATASHDSTARVWSTDRLVPLRMMVGHLSDVNVRAVLSRQQPELRGADPTRVAACSAYGSTQTATTSPPVPRTAARDCGT